jgi:hypothetical protein
MASAGVPVIQIVQMLIGLAVVIWLFHGTSPVKAVHSQILACQMASPNVQFEVDITGSRQSADQPDNRRIIAIGDVHGAYKGLLEVLHGAKITRSPDACEWAQQSSDGVILVQQGDLVDRGPQALEALQCLRHLQKEAPKYNSKVVRIIGSKS